MIDQSTMALEAAVQHRDFCRELFTGWPGDDTAEAVRGAEDEVDKELIMLGEWTCD